MVSKKVFFLLLFLLVNISTNFVLGGLKFWTDVLTIYVKGTVSQIFVSGLSFHFMSKNRQLHDFFFDFLFLKYNKKTNWDLFPSSKNKSSFSDIFFIFCQEYAI